MHYIDSFIDNFIESFNHKPIVLDIRKVSKIRLRVRLFEDSIGNLDELTKANFITISNCKLHGWTSLEDLADKEYTLMVLEESVGEYYHHPA